MNPAVSWRIATRRGLYALLLAGGVLTVSGHASRVSQERPPSVLTDITGEQAPTESSGQELDPNSSQADEPIDFQVGIITLDQLANLVEECRPLLSDFFLRASRRTMHRSELEVLHIGIAFDFASLAVSVAPDRQSAWRQLLAIASASDPDDPTIQAAEGEALRQISQLDPNDEVIRLRRLLWTVEQQETADARLELFAQLLEPDSVAVIGEQVAARLALDMAQLLYRTGDSDGFAERLAQAVELSPSYPRATAMAAGYFATPGDPLDHAELLIAALLADPVAVEFGIELGKLALTHGAYSAASRMLELSRSAIRATGSDSNALVVEEALSLWGMGKPDAAIDVIDFRMRVLDQTVRERQRADAPRMAPTELAAIAAPVPPSLALAGSVILSIGEDQTRYREFVKKAMAGFTLLLAENRDAPVEPTPASEAAQGALLLEAAAFAAWQAEDPASIEQLITAAQGYVELSEETLAQFEAWSAIAEGRNEAAIALLESLSNEDNLSKLALSIAYERTGRRTQAAKIWFELVRSAPGTIIGIWSRDKLESTLSTSIPPSSLARDLDFLIKQIPTTIDRIAMDRGRAYALRIEAVNPTIAPFERILYRLEIANRSGLPLSIGPDGPIRPTVALLASITKSTVLGRADYPWMVLEIDRQFAIEPRETYQLVIDLSEYSIADSSFANPDTGSTLGLRVVTNFVSAGSMLIPGPFGEKATARLLRLDGVTADSPWRRDALDSAMKLDGIKSIEDLLLLLQVATNIDDTASEERRKFRDMVFLLVRRIYVELPAVARAWIAALTPVSAPAANYDQIVEMFMADRDPLVMNAMLAKLTWSVGIAGSRAPYFDIVEESGVTEVMGLSERMRLLWFHVEEDQAKEDAVGR